MGGTDKAPAINKRANSFDGAAAEPAAVSSGSKERLCSGCGSVQPTAANYCMNCGSNAWLSQSFSGAEIDSGTEKTQRFQVNDLIDEALQNPVAKKMAEIGEEAAQIGVETLNTKFAKGVMAHAAIGAIIAVPVPLVGPLFCATLGAAIGVYRQITDKK